MVSLTDKPGKRLIFAELDTASAVSVIRTGCILTSACNSVTNDADACGVVRSPVALPSELSQAGV